MRQGPCPTLEGARGFWIKKKRLLASLKTIFLPSVFWEWVLGRTLGVELKCDTLLCGKGGPPPPPQSVTQECFQLLGCFLLHNPDWKNTRLCGRPGVG